MSLDPKAAQPLQFDTATPGKVRAETTTTEQSVTCVACNKTIADRYFDVNAQTVCDRCKLQIARQAETPEGFGVFARATLFGLGAAIAGAIVYYAVIAITEFEIGLVAIAIGYMVGYAVRRATADRGGLRFQILAIVLTYWAVGLAYTPFVFSGDTGQQEEAIIAPASTDAAPIEPASAPVEPASDPTEPASEDKALGAAGIAIAAGIMLALTFALPVLSVVSSMPGGLISAAIIAFGMQQAWRMTAAPHLVITGPFRIARPRVSA